MSGHSKWNNIKNKKAQTDAKKSKEFTQIAKLITLAVKKTGVGDPGENASLRLALEKARSVNLPSNNIKRAIDRGLGKGETGNSLEEVLYEGYAPHGVGVLVEAHTDNKARTGASVRFEFSKHGGTLSGPGSAMYLFTMHAAGEPQVQIYVDLNTTQMAEVQELVEALEAADDVDAVWHNARVAA